MATLHPRDRGKTLATTGRAGLAQFSSTYFTVSDGIVSLAAGAVTTLAALTDTTISTPSSAQILIYDGSDSWDNKSVSGDATISAAGAVSVSDLTIASEARGDILRRNASSWGRLSAKTSGQILVGDGTDIVSVAVSGDATLAANGALSVSDLTITSEAQGDVIYFNGSNWVRLGPGTDGQFLMTQGAAANPTWSNAVVGTADKLSSPYTFEGGTYDPATTVTTQTTSAAALTIPDLAGTAQEWMFTKVAQTVLNKTLDDATCKFGDTADATKDLFFSLGGATTAKTMTIVSSHTDDRSVTLPDATCTLVGHDTTQTLSNKTLTTPKIVTTGYIADGGGDELLYFVEDTTPVNYLIVTNADTGVSPSLTAGGSDANVDLLIHGKATGNVQLADGTDPTKIIDFELNGATTAKTMTVTCSHTDDRALTLPDATDTLVGKATTDTFTNKTINADGTGNSITNINADELDPVAAPSTGDASDSVYNLPFIVQVNISNQGAAVNVYNSNAPFKFKVLDVWSVNKSADGGTWKLDNGTNDLCSAVTVAASDTDVDRIADLDDAYATIAANGSLRVVPDAGGALDCDIYVMAVRVD